METIVSTDARQRHTHNIKRPQLVCGHMKNTTYLPVSYLSPSNIYSSEGSTFLVLMCIGFPHICGFLDGNDKLVLALVSVDICLLVLLDTSLQEPTVFEFSAYICDTEGSWGLVWCNEPASMFGSVGFGAIEANAEQRKQNKTYLF